MKEAYDKFFGLNNQGIRDSSYWHYSEIIEIFASCYHKIMRNQKPNAMVRGQSIFEEPTVAFEKYRRNHCA